MSDTGRSFQDFRNLDRSPARDSPYSPKIQQVTRLGSSQRSVGFWPLRSDQWSVMASHPDILNPRRTENEEASIDVRNLPGIHSNVNGTNLTANITQPDVSFRDLVTNNAARFTAGLDGEVGE